MRHQAWTNAPDDPGEPDSFGIACRDTIRSERGGSVRAWRIGAFAIGVVYLIAFAVVVCHLWPMVGR